MKKLFKTIDDKLRDIGFIKIKENKFGASYDRFIKEYNYTQRVDICHKQSGRHLLQSYDVDLLDKDNIGNVSVGLTAYEMELFIKKMKKLGMYSK